MKTPIYLDHHATTPLDPRVLDAMLPYLREDFGNASSRNHLFGKRAGQAVELARERISQAIGAEDPSEVVFTSGATESNNLALKGLAHIFKGRGNHIITTSIEHRSVLDTCQHLQENGFQVTYLKVNRDGLINLEELKAAITDQTVLISVMHANNEIGVLQSIAEIGQIAKKRGVFFHCDAVQSVGKVYLHVESMGIDLLSISAHKVYGPKGIGALYVRKKNPRVRLEPLIHGGGQERSLRSGTLNVAGIVGFGKALEIAQSEMSEESIRLFTLREQLRKKILDSLDEVHVNGNMEKRLPGNLNLSFSYVEGEALLFELQKDLAVSSGSACTEASLEPSYVLRALGTREDLVHTSLRFGVGRFNTTEEIDHAADVVIRSVKKLRSMSSLYKAIQANLNRGQSR